MQASYGRPVFDAFARRRNRLSASVTLTMSLMTVHGDCAKENVR